MRFSILAGFAAFGTALVIQTPAAAHCDGLDGPVVTAARQALEAGNPNAILVWVQAKDEPEVRRAFSEALAVRRLSPQAREMADRYFFETLVRLHRAGEGAPYTGLKPAGRDLGPAIPLADKAVASGSERELMALLSSEVEQGVRARFTELQRKRNYKPNDLSAGREYIESYVAFVHYVERLHQAAEAKSTGHYPEEQDAQQEHRD